MKNLNCIRMLMLLLLTLPAVAQAQFYYDSLDGWRTITIIRYSGPGGAATLLYVKPNGSDILDTNRLQYHPVL